MNRRAATFLLALAAAWPAGALDASARPEVLDAERVNGAAVENPAEPSRAVLIRIQVLLDRAHVSPGVIDGHAGDNLDKALRAYRGANGLGNDPTVDGALLEHLTRTDAAPALVAYRVTEEDVRGPWTPSIPSRFEELSGLERLGYRDPAEMLAERFHMDGDLLRALNPEARFDRPGTEITVAGVDTSADPSRVAEPPPDDPAAKEAAKALKETVARILVDKANGSFSAFDEEGRRVLFGPVTVGSPEKPAPSGTLRVTRIATNPNYTYDPDYAFKGVKAKRAFTIAPGPNNPVGSVWIALDREGYGIHGTPEPAQVGKTQSHGCVRLTNWTALALARRVSRDVPVEFRE